MKQKRFLVAKEMCATCPFRTDGNALQLEPETLARIYGNLIEGINHMCHAPQLKGSSGKVKRTYSEDGKRRGPNDGPRMSIADMCELQGLPRCFLDGPDCPLTETGKRKVIGNGVPLPMGRAIARAVKRATS